MKRKEIEKVIAKLERSIRKFSDYDKSKVNKINVLRGELHGKERD